MQTILLLSRGKRLSRIFAETARNLARDFRVVAVLGSWAHDTAEDEIADWQGIPNLKTYDLLDEIRRRATGDLAGRARSIEQEIELPLYRSASNYMLYRRFAKSYFGMWRSFYDTETEILTEFVGSHDLFRHIMTEDRPVLGFCETPDLISHRVAQAVGRKHNCFVLGNAFNNIFGDGISYFTYGCNRRNPLLEHYYRNAKQIEPAAWQQADAFVSRLTSDGLHNAHYIEFHKRSISQRPSIPARLIRNWRAGLSAAQVKNLPMRISHERNRRWLEANMTSSIPNGPYILVSMHYQPEASTCMVASRWVDQDCVIEQMAINAPSGIRIAVKENPKGFGFRGRGYYERLKDMPNVDLIHPTVPNNEIMRNATVIFPIAGTAGMEGIALGKRVAVLGRPAYDIYSGLRRLDYPEDVFRHLADPEWQPENLHEDRRMFLAAMAQSCFYLGRPAPNTPWPSAEEAGENYAAAMRRFINTMAGAGIGPADIESTL